VGKAESARRLAGWLAGWQGVEWVVVVVVVVQNFAVEFRCALSRSFVALLRCSLLLEWRT